MTENEIAQVIVDAALKVRKALGPGLFESVDHRVLAYELERRGLPVDSKQRMPIRYESLSIDEAFEADLIVNESVIVERKFMEALGNIHMNPLLTCLRLTGLRLGPLINFNVELIRDGILRVVNDLPDAA